MRIPGAFDKHEEQRRCGRDPKGLRGKTTVVAGPRGLANLPSPTVCRTDFYGNRRNQPEAETGKTHHPSFPDHTCGKRHLSGGYAGLFFLISGGYGGAGAENYFPEFEEFAPPAVSGVQALKEPDCAVKAALGRGEISRLRYENYLGLYQELKEKRRY